MGMTEYTQEIKVRVPAKRMFKALVIENYTIMPKVNPDIKSIQILQGDGGPGTIRQTNLPDGSPWPYIKHEFQRIDTENYEFEFTLFEGGVLGDILEKIDYLQRFEDLSEGESLITIVSKYHTKGDIQLNKEEIKAGKERFATPFYKLTEQYLLDNPEVCA